MTGDLLLRCACGKLRGVARGVCAKRGNHVVCYCDDCQAFAHALGAADRTLDADGGTEIFQTSSGRVEFSEGGDRLACLRLRPGTRATLRWYAVCCRTPIGNSLGTRQLPFVGLIRAVFEPASDSRARDELIGPVRAHVHTRFAKRRSGELSADVGFPAGMMLRLLRITLAARLRGDHLRSPFFDRATGAPIVPPHVLGEDELRRALDALGES